MSLSSVRCWLKGISKSTPSSRHGPSRRPKRTCRPGLEVLEDRSLLSTTLLTVAPNPATDGQAVTLTATVTRTDRDMIQPGTGTSSQGKVTFFDGPTPLGNVKVTPTPGSTTEGTAQFSTTALGVGTHSLSAQYSGDTSPSSGLGLPYATGSSTSNAVTEVINPPPVPLPVPLPAATLVNVTSQVKLTLMQQKRGRGGVLKERMKLRLGGPDRRAGSLFVVLRGLPRRVRLKNASGQGPFLRLDVGQVSPGQEFNLTFLFLPPRRRVAFTADVFVGSSPL